MSLEEMQEQVERIYIDMENELLLNIAKKISVGKPMEIDKWNLETNSPIVGSGGVNEWQLERLKELGGLNEQNAKIIAKYSGKTAKEVEKIFQRAREIGTEIDKGTIELGIKAGILNEINPKMEDIQVSSIIDSAIREVLTTFNLQNNSLLASAGREYTDIINKVSSKLLAGTKTVDKAMQEAVTELSKKGLTGFTARNGAQWSPEAYTKMIMRTNTQNTINKVQEERMKLSGCKYVEINQYSGARPKCADDQGKIFALDGNTTPIEDGRGRKIKVHSWSSSSYGQPDGILGINCGHSRHSFVPGISVYRNEPIPKTENDEGYMEKQQQRSYERTIRNKKREIAMLKQTGAESSYIKSKQKDLTRYRNEYSSFLSETGRNRISANEWIGSVTISSHGDKTKITKDDIKYLKDYVSSDSYKINDMLRRNVNLSKEWEDKKTNINKAIKKLPKYNGNIVRVLEINNTSSFLKDYKIGKPIKYKEFLSFSNKEGYNKNANVKIYTISKNGRDIRGYNKKENEIVYPLNSNFIVKNIVKHNGIIYIWLEE